LHERVCRLAVFPCNVEKEECSEYCPNEYPWKIDRTPQEQEMIEQNDYPSIIMKGSSSIRQISLKELREIRKNTKTKTMKEIHKRQP
jgi:hypothetical protein